MKIANRGYVKTKHFNTDASVLSANISLSAHGVSTFSAAYSNINHKKDRDHFGSYISEILCLKFYEATDIEPQVSGLWHRGQQLYLLISCSRAQCLHTLHIQNWYWMGRPVTMQVGSFPSPLRERQQDQRFYVGILFYVCSCK